MTAFEETNARLLKMFNLTPIYAKFIFNT